jgi:peptidoglycan/xylan/chitin deacetylase (PgdA/CDA1 family)
MNTIRHRPYLRSRIGDALVAAGLMPVLWPFHNRGRLPIVVLAYHRITPPEQEHSKINPFDSDLISATTEDFEWQMRYLRDHFEVVPLTRLVAHLSGRDPIDRPSVIVTFDDGFRDNYTYAYPILKELGIPATIFLSTEMVDSREAIWFQMVSFLMMKSDPQSIQVEGIPERLPRSNDAQIRRSDARMLQKHLKSLPHRKFQSTLVDLKTYMKSDNSFDDLDDAVAITWEQAREMQENGIHFGSHTVTHGILSRMDQAEQQRELIQSKRRIEEALGKPVQAIAYPVGRFSSINDDVLYETSCAGYRLGACYESGVNWANQLSPLCLLRQNVELSTTRSRFKAMVGLPNWIR